MAIYQFTCEKGHNLEVILSYSDPHPKKCPSCSSSLKRIYSPPAIIFKGSGFYNTDYKKRTPSKEKPKNNTPEKKIQAVDKPSDIKK